MLFDYNKNGKIFERDVGPVIRSVGLKPSEAEVKSIQADVRQMGQCLLLFVRNCRDSVRILIILYLF